MFLLFGIHVGVGRFPATTAQSQHENRLFVNLRHSIASHDRFQPNRHASLDLTAAIMSVFSKIRLSRKAAKEHKHKVAEKEADKPVKVPYRHVPTHAAVDALSGAPSSWQQEDRSKIMEHHKRRSQMVISRTGSSLSTTSYMNAAAGPSSQAPPLPRNNSYNSYNPTWFNRDGDVYYLNSEPQPKKFKPSRGHSYHDSGIGPSPLATASPSEGTSSLSSLSRDAGAPDFTVSVPKQYSTNL